ncbi:MAG: hypothetical protein ACP5L5_10425 [Vulcanisaeta sp.]|uniref:hypothetical protein n=1 Tax=Vulcanisaeta sp. TaxID=2020871 RepID=UPI003D10A103
MAGNGGLGNSSDRERMILLYHGVSRIFDGYIASIALGILLAIVLVAIILSSDDNVNVLIHNFGIFFITVGILGLPFTFFFMYGGFTYLARADKGRYGIGVLGAIGLLALGLVLISEGAYLVITRVSYSIFLIMSVITIIAGFVFELLMYIVLYRLGDDFSVSYLTAGVIVSLFATVLLAVPVINIVGDVIGLIAFVLILVGLNEVKKSIERTIAH